MTSSNKIQPEQLDASIPTQNGLLSNTVAGTDPAGVLTSLVLGANLNLSGGTLDAIVPTSASSGVDFYLDDTNIIASGSENNIGVKTVTKIAVNGTPEQTASISVTNETKPVMAFLYNTALGRTVLGAGPWYPITFAFVSDLTNASSILTNVYIQTDSTVLVPGVTMTMTDSGTTRTVTASNSIFTSGMANADLALCWYLQTPKGLYPIIAFTSGTVVTIQVPSGYGNESGIDGIFWAFKFSMSTGTLSSTTVKRYDPLWVEGSYVLNSTDGIGFIYFARTANLSPTTISFTYNDEVHYSQINSSLATLHNDLAEVRNVGSAEQYGHLSYMAETIYGAKTFNNSPIVSALTASTIISCTAGKALQSLSIGSSLSLNTNTLDTAQDIRTSAGPTFAGLNLGSSTAAFNPVFTTDAAANQSVSIRFNSAGNTKWELYRPLNTFDLRLYNYTSTIDELILPSAGGVIVSSLTESTIVSCDANKKLESLVVGSNLTLSSNILSANVSTSATVGVGFYLDDTNIIASSSENLFQVNSLLSTPNTAVAEQLDTVAVTSATSPVYVEAYRTTSALGRNFWQAGPWVQHMYANCSSATGGTSTVVMNVFNIINFTGYTVTMSGSGTTRTCTASSPIFLAPMANASKLLCWFIETPKGVYQISAFTSNTVVTVTVPTGYINESTQPLIFWAFTFSGNTGALPTALTYLPTTYGEGAFAVGPTDKIGVIMFATTARTASTNVTFTHNGNLHYSYLQTPFALLHNSLAEIGGVSATEPYGHVDYSTQTIYGAKTFNSAISAPNYTSTVATGTQPYACTSTTKNTNLNADTTDGYNLDQDVLSTSTPTFRSIVVSHNGTNNSISIETDTDKEASLEFGSAPDWRFYRPASDDSRLYLYDDINNLNFIQWNATAAAGSASMWFGNASYGGAAMNIVNSAASNGYLTFYSASTAKWALHRIASSNNFSIDEVVSGTTPTARMNFVAGGKVGIGTAAPDPTGRTGAGLHVYNSTVGTTTWAGRIVASGPNYAWVCGEFDGYVLCGGHNAALNAWAAVRTDSNWGFGIAPTHKIHTSGGEYIWHDQTDAEAYGGFVSNNTTAGHYWLTHIATNERYFFSYDGTWKADILSTDGTYTKSSDARLKDDIKPLSNIMDKIMQLEVDTFTIKADPEKKPKIGLIAQKVLPLFPEFVSQQELTKNSGDMYYGLNYDGFGVIALKGLQEQQIMIDNLIKRVDALERG